MTPATITPSTLINHPAELDAQASPQRSWTEKEIRHSVNRQLRRNNAYCALQLLVECLRMVQQHRGAVMGYLGNHRAFEENIQHTAERIDCLLSVLADFHFVIEKKSLVSITEEWQTAGRVDLKDTASQQFELHCHLIQKMIDFIWQVIEANDFTLEHAHHTRQFYRVLLNDFLTVIEKMGQCRALATLICAKVCPAETETAFRTKLDFTLKNTSELLEMAYQEFSYLPDAMSGPVFTLLQQYQCRRKLDKLDHLTRKSIIAPKKISISSESVFSLYTMAMDEKYAVFYRLLELGPNQTPIGFLAGAPLCR